MQRNRLIAVTLIAALMLLIVPLTVSAAASVTAANVADDKQTPASAETLGPNLLSNPGLEGQYLQQCSLRTDPPWVPAPTPCDPNDYDYVSRALWATAQVPVHRFNRQRVGANACPYELMHRLAWELIPSLQGVYAGHAVAIPPQEAAHAG